METGISNGKSNEITSIRLFQLFAILKKSRTYNLTPLNDGKLSGSDPQQVNT